jgi:hypothetical protein
MKKALLAGLIFSFSLTFVSQGQCWPWSKKEAPAASPQALAAPSQQEPAVIKAAAPASEEKAAVKETPKMTKADMEKMRVLREKKKGELNNWSWDIDTALLSGKGAKQKDNITIQDNKFFSEGFVKEGFPASNFTLSVQDNGVTVVETMQTSEKKGMIFWRVEFDPTLAACKGILSRQLPGNKTEDYSFISTAKKPVSNNPAPEEKKPEGKKQAAPAAAPKAKKK